MEISILIVWLALCGVAAYIAGNKGRSGVGIFFLSFFFSPVVGIIVALVMSPDLAAQGKKKCPNCAEFVQPDAKTCRFCQHSFVEEEAAERARQEAQLAAAVARHRAEYEAQQAAEAAKPWLQRNLAALLTAVLFIAGLGSWTWYVRTHSAPVGVSAPSAVSENKPAPAWVTEERSKVPKSVWDRKVAWAAQHHCYFTAMSRDEIVQALGKPAEETAYSLTYKRQTQDCASYNGDACAEYKTEHQIVFLKDGYDDKDINFSRGCCTLYGEHQYSGFDIPDFKLSTAPRKRQPTTEDEARLAAEAASLRTKEYCEANGFIWSQESGCTTKDRSTK